MPLLLSVIQVTRLASIVLIHAAVAQREREMIRARRQQKRVFPLQGWRTALVQYKSQEQYNCTLVYI